MAFARIVELPLEPTAAAAQLKQALAVPNTAIALVVGDHPIAKTSATKLELVLEKNPQMLRDVRGFYLPLRSALSPEEQRAWLTQRTVAVTLTFDRRVAARLDGDDAGKAAMLLQAMVWALAGKAM